MEIDCFRFCFLVPLSCCGARRMSSASVRLRPSPTAATRSPRCIRHWRRSGRSPESHLRFDSESSIPAKGTPKGVPFAGAADRNRTGTLFTARDFKSLVSTYSTTTAHSAVIVAHFYVPVKDISALFCLKIRPCFFVGYVKFSKSSCKFSKNDVK